MNSPAGVPTWHERLAEALERNQDDPAARFVQLATIAVGPDGSATPANRTLVFRGFHREGTDLLFVTDCRSGKVQQIRNRPTVSVCWYFPNTREQFRLSGQVRVVDADAVDSQVSEERRTLWERLSDSTKAQFGWGQPGAPTESGTSGPLPSAAPDTFCLLVLSPSRVDHLQVGVAPHRRTIHLLTASDTWDSRDVNP
jgi:PPOX class probable FMN-dependent enzyme